MSLDLNPLPGLPPDPGWYILQKPYEEVLDKSPRLVKVEHTPLGLFYSRIFEVKNTHGYKWYGPLKLK